MIDNHRTRLLAHAADLINGQRQEDYGPPSENFGAIADMWSAYLGFRLTPVDVCHLMALLKIARLRNGPHCDSSADACGYLALGSELTGIDDPTPEC